MAPRQPRLFPGWMLSLVLAQALAMPVVAQDIAPAKVQGVALLAANSPESVTEKAEPAVPSETLPSNEPKSAFFPNFLLGNDPNSGVLSSFAVGARAWLSWARSDSNFGGGGPIGFATPLSDLKWHNLVSETGEVSASALLLNRVVLNASGGGGVTNSGQLVDRDFALSQQQGLFSESIAPTTGNSLSYFNADLGWRFWENACCFFDGLIGYQYWREHYLAQGGTQSVSFPGLGLPPSGFPFPPGPSISEQYTWQSFQIGGQTAWQFSPRWALKGRLMFMPVTWFENDDVHFLRVPLLTSTERATGGFGVTADLRVTYWLCRGLFLELGYRIWDVTSGSGQISESFSGVPTFSLPFNQASTVRQGLTLGLTYQF